MLLVGSVRDVVEDGELSGGRLRLPRRPERGDVERVETGAAGDAASANDALIALEAAERL